MQRKELSENQLKLIETIKERGSVKFGEFNTLTLQSLLYRGICRINDSGEVVLK